MQRVGFSMKGLLTAVTLTAIGLYALVNASRMWIAVVGTVTVLVLLTASLAVACRPGPRRAFWLGFAIFGWAYLLLTVVAGDVALLLPTDPVNEWLYELVHREGPVEGWENWKTVPPQPYFEVVCHYLWSWLLALAGGLLARYFYVAQQRSPQDPNGQAA